MIVRAGGPAEINPVPVCAAAVLPIAVLAIVALTVAARPVAVRAIVVRVIVVLAIAAPKFDYEEVEISDAAIPGVMDSAVVVSVEEISAAVILARAARGMPRPEDRCRALAAAAIFPAPLTPVSPGWSKNSTLSCARSDPCAAIVPHSP
jgi:hypothetical protein